MSGLDERQRRILTTHTGSLPRPDALSGLLFARMSGKSYDPAELARQTTQSVAAIVRRQIDLSHGAAAVSFQAWPIAPGANDGTRENTDFPAFYQRRLRVGVAAAAPDRSNIGQQAGADQTSGALPAPPRTAFMPSVAMSCRHHGEPLRKRREAMRWRRCRRNTGRGGGWCRSAIRRTSMPRAAGQGGGRGAHACNIAPRVAPPLRHQYRPRTSDWNQARRHRDDAVRVQQSPRAQWRVWSTSLPTTGLIPGCITHASVISIPSCRERIVRWPSWSATASSRATRLCKRWCRPSATEIVRPSWGIFRPRARIAACRLQPYSAVRWVSEEWDGRPRQLAAHGARG